jgi:oligopeptide transport system substrate-binding protein
VRKNPYYWDRDNVALNGIVFRPTESSNTEEKMFRSGQLHATSTVANTKIPIYRQQPEPALTEGPFMGSYYYMFNTKRPPLDSLPVRRALALAVDRETLANTVLAGTAIPSANYVPIGMPDYAHPQVLGFNPEEARRLLAQAGYPNGEGFPAITLIYNTQENHRSVAVAIQQMWRTHLNLDIEIANQEWMVYLDTLENRDYDIARMGWTGDIYPGIFLDRLVTTGTSNRLGFSNAEYDNIILNRIRATGDADEQMALYTEAERVLLEEMPLLPIYTYKNKFLAQPSMEGMPSNLASMINWKYIKLDPDAPAWEWTPLDP